MNLIEALIAACTTNKLRKIIDKLAIKNVDKRKTADMKEALLHSPKISVNTLVEFFTVKELKNIIQDYHIPSYGQKKSLTDIILKRKNEVLGQNGSSKKTREKKNEPKGKRIFVAIDFETADRYRDSACAVALVRVESGKIVSKEHRLIKPPRKYFEFSYIHGITWGMVSSKPEFRVVWHSLDYFLKGAEFLAAHNASFDRSVLNSCCEKAHMKTPSIPFQCTVALARKKWNIYPTKLPNVCDYLGIPLNHHDALSDAMACAEIVLAADACN